MTSGRAQALGASVGQRKTSMLHNRRGTTGMRNQGYIVNFHRDRDSYIVPRALEASGLLERLVTDIYYEAGSWKALLPRSLHAHHANDLPGTKTSDCLSSAAIQMIGSRLALRFFDPDPWADQALGLLTARIWRKRECHLLLYSGYALETFRAALSSPVERRLFLYHPHHKLITDILEEDAARFPEAARALACDKENRPRPRDARIDQEIQLATAIVTASTFTSRSVAHAGHDKPVSVVPYGLAVERPVAPRTRGRCRFLFVGQAVQRKGVHHLFRAWKAAGLGASALTCVCATGDHDLMNQAPEDVELRGKIPLAELHRLMAETDVFVMPSLVEGFGLVYLEAATWGDFLIYTANTGVPDLDLGDEGGLCVPAGDVESLAAALAEAERRKIEGELDPRRMAARACRVNFERFREGLVKTLQVSPPR